MAFLHPGNSLGGGPSQDQISELNLDAAIDDDQWASNEVREKRTDDDSSSVSYEKGTLVAPATEVPERLQRLEAPVSLLQEPKGRSTYDYFVVTDNNPLVPGDDETTIDIIAIPCPGVTSRYSTWSRDDHMTAIYGNPTLRQPGEPLTSREAQRAHFEHFRALGRQQNGIPSQLLQQSLPHNSRSKSDHNHPTHSEVTAHSWIRHDIRKEAPEARTLLVKHPEMTTDTTLDELADRLLEELYKKRSSSPSDLNRPIFFICHSIGGLIVKLALTKAANIPTYHTIFHSVYGIAFFGTPHRGSSYLSMKEVSPSIQALLELEAPLSGPIIHDIRSGSSKLAVVQERFRELCSDMQIWTFYETIDSTIMCRTPTPTPKGSGVGVVGVGIGVGLGTGQVMGMLKFTAPLAPVRSAIMGVRQEKVFPLQTDHRNCASFGDRNSHTQKVFLQDLVFHIKRAGKMSKEPHNELSLYDHVMVEVHGYYEDSGAGNTMSSLGTLGPIRPWSNRVSLHSFLETGAQKCLQDRLTAVSPDTGKPLIFPRYQDRNSEPALHDMYLAHGENIDGTNVGLGVTTVELTDPSATLRRQSAVSPAREQGHSQQVAPERASDSTIVRSAQEGSVYITLHKDICNNEERMSRPLQREDSVLGNLLGSDGLQPVSAERRSSFVLNPFDPGRQEDMVPKGLGAPDIRNQKFVWVHLAFNNPIWVEEMMRAMKTYDGINIDEFFTSERWASRFNKGRHAQHYASFMRPTAILDLDQPTSPNPTSPPRAPIFQLPLDTPPTLTFHMPYLHYDLYPASVKRRTLIDTRRHRGRARPVPRKIATIGSLELQTIWEYLSYEFPINCRRTLDQYGFPTLQDTRARDDDQMLYKMTKERYGWSGQVDLEERKEPHPVPSWNTSSSESSGGSGLPGGGAGERKKKHKVDKLAIADDLLGGNVLMVDQLWMWAPDPETLITFFPNRESSPSEGPLYLRCDLRDNIFNEANADLTRRCEDAYDMAALVILHAVTVLLERPSHQDLEVFRIFEEAISQLTEKLTSALKKFRTSSTLGSEVLNYPPPANEGSIRQRYLLENNRIEKENRDSTSALLELRDLEDELTTILNLLTTQQKNIELMLKNYRNLVMRTSMGAFGEKYLEEALAAVDEFIGRTKKMLKRVVMTRDEYDKLLEMVQRHSQISEVRLQRLQADLASAQGRSVLIFTTFTVIFLPLSFFTSLFGMNTQEWQKELPTFAEVGSISLPMSAFVILLTLLIAWSTTTRAFFKGIGHIFMAMWQLFWDSVTTTKHGIMLCFRAKKEVAAPEPEDSDKDDEKMELRKPAVPRDTSDMSFWGRPPPTKDNYEIPPGNRRSVAIEKAGHI